MNAASDVPLPETEIVPVASDSPSERAEAIRGAWTDGAPPDAKAVLAADPMLLTDKSVVLDLAYEEFCLRREQGEVVEIESFCRGFPVYQTSIRRLLAADLFLEANPDLLTPSEPPSWPTTGQRIGDLTILRELGRGGFARVFLATEASTGDRAVAVKFSIGDDNEARTLGRLVHENVVPILWARPMAETGLTAVAMPYLGSATLTDLFDKAYPLIERPPPLSGQTVLAAAALRPGDPTLDSRPAHPALSQGAFDEAVAYLMSRVAAALAFVHAHGICHRDLKPSNVLLTPAGEPLLLDFNLAAPSERNTARLGGTLPYMATEHLHAVTAGGPTPGPPADVYALGVIGFELMTGKHPFGPIPISGTIASFAADMIERQADGPPKIHSPLGRLFCRCLATNPQERPTAAEVEAALRYYLGWSHTLRRRLAARPVLVVLTGLAALVIGRDLIGWLTTTPPPAMVAPTGSLVTRGREHLAAGRVGEACAVLRQAVQEQPTGPTAALLAYALTRAGLHREAVDWSDHALAQGVRTAELLNNRAHAAIHLGSEAMSKASPAEAAAWFAQAERDLESALTSPVPPPAAQYHRALLALRRRLLGLEKINLTRARTDVDHPSQRTKLSARAYVDAAHLYLLEDAQTTAQPDQAVAYLRQAIHAGLPPESLSRDVRWLRLQSRSDFRALLRQPPVEGPLNRTPEILDPIPLP